MRWSSSREVWRRFAAETGGQWCPGGVSSTGVIQYHVRSWTATLDNVTSWDGAAYLRVRAPFYDRFGLRLHVEAPSALGTLRHWFTADSDLFDRLRVFGPMVAQAGKPDTLRYLWETGRLEPVIRIARPRLITIGTDLDLPVVQSHRWRDPGGLRRLLIHVPGPAADPSRLEAARLLAVRLLDALDRLTQADRDPVTRLIEDLQTPGVTVAEPGTLVLWDGNRIRTRAALELGKLREERAIPFLVEMLSERSALLRMAALRALHTIGHPSSIEHIVACLGDLEETGGRSVSAAAQALLRSAGRAELADHFVGVITRDLDPGDVCRKYPNAFVRAFAGVLNSPRPREVVNAALALGELGGRQALPHLNRVLRHGALDPAATALVEGVVSRLTRASVLPLPADGTSLASLPRPAEAQEPDPARLPVAPED